MMPIYIPNFRDLMLSSIGTHYIRRAYQCYLQGDQFGFDFWYGLYCSNHSETVAECPPYDFSIIVPRRLA